jgi:CMP-N,N'-diacetyllegionaminic acid synthase
MLVAVITARANSKGLPGKNMLDLGGKPLIEHTYEIAANTKGFDRVILSTDMDAAIDLAKSKYPRVEVPFKRPEALCLDTTSHAEVIRHLIHFLKDEGNAAEHIVILQPTSPYKSVEEMEKGCELLKSGVESVLGVSKVMHHPAEYLYQNKNGELQFLMPEFKGMRRQEYPDLYFDNGAFYGFTVPFFERTGHFFNEKSELLLMGEKSLIDIDTPFEMALARGVVSF